MTTVKSRLKFRFRGTRAREAHHLLDSVMRVVSYARHRATAMLGWAQEESALVPRSSLPQHAAHPSALLRAVLCNATMGWARAQQLLAASRVLAAPPPPPGPPHPGPPAPQLAPSLPPRSDPPPLPAAPQQHHQEYSGALLRAVLCNATMGWARAQQQSATLAPCPGPAAPQPPVGQPPPGPKPGPPSPPDPSQGNGACAGVL